MLNPLHMNWPRQPGPIHMCWSMHPKLTLATHAFLLLRRTSVTLHGAIHAIRYAPGRCPRCRNALPLKENNSQYVTGSKTPGGAGARTTDLTHQTHGAKTCTLDQGRPPPTQNIRGRPLIMCAVPVVATPTLPELRVHPSLCSAWTPPVGPDTLSRLGGLGEFSGVSITSICQIKSI